MEALEKRVLVKYPLSKQSVQFLGTMGRYLRSRILEFPVWLGIPTIGLAASGKILDFSELTIFYVATGLSVWHVLLLNDWGGLVRNPAESARFVRGENPVAVARLLLWASVLLYAGSLLLFGVLGKDLVLLAVIGVGVSTLYSHPGLHFKERPLGAPAMHFLGGSVQFLLGYCLFSPFELRAVLMAPFFSAVLASGHFIHQCTDRDEDEKGGINTYASRFGTAASARTALGLFVLSHIYFLTLYAFKLVTPIETIIFTFPLLVHIVFGRRILADMNPPVAFLYHYRRAYRGAFAIATLFFLCWKFLRFVLE